MELNQIKFKWYSNLNHCNANMITCTSEACHTHDHMVYNDQTIANAIWLIWKTYMEFEFAFQMQYNSFKLNLPQINTLHIMEQLHHVLVHFHSMLPPLLMIASDDRRSETVITPKKKTTVKTRVSSARQANPIDHVYKILLPSRSRICMFRRSPRHVLSHSWTTSDAWPIILSLY